MPLSAPVRPCFAQDFICVWTGLRPRVLLVTTQALRMHDELLVEYGDEYWKARSAQQTCTHADMHKHTCMHACMFVSG